MFFSDYYESAENITISKQRAKEEIEKHFGFWDQFLQDVGEQEKYDAQQVLVWLGY